MKQADWFTEEDVENAARAVNPWIFLPERTPAATWNGMKREDVLNLARRTLSAVKPKSETDLIREIAAKLRKGGARVPAPDAEGTIESAVRTGLSIALLVVEEYIPEDKQ